MAAFTYQVTNTGYKILKDGAVLLVQEGIYANLYAGATMEDKAQAHINAILAANCLTLETAQQAKLAEISAACQNAVYAGVDATDTKGTEHFSLTLPDQTNLSASVEAVAQGAASVPYHADGQLCRQFTADEIKAVYAAAKAYIMKQTTLCNHLNVWIRRCTSVDEVNAITYASTLPDDLLKNYNSILGITTGAAS